MEPRWRRYLRFWGPDPAADFEDEIEFHLQTKIEDLVAAGMTPEAARREALRQFGPVRPVRRECSVLGRERLGKASRAECLAGWQRDVKYAGRMLWKTRASTAAAILILALGIGACTSVFTFLDRLLLAPLPVPKPGQLQLVTCMRPGEKPCRYDEYLLLRDSDRRFSGLAAEGGLVANERRGKEKIEHPAFGRSVSGNFFSVLGAQATLGRTLTPADDAPGAPPVAVATYDFWSRRYGRAPDVLGRVIYLNNLPFTIVGVLPRGLNGLNKASGPPLYITVGAQREIFGWDTLNAVDTTIFGRLKPGVSPRPATIAGLRVRCEDGSRGIAGTSGEKKRSLLLVGGIVALLLLMGCLNIACLLLARGAARQPEMAIRLSLGAGRGRIVRQSLIESCLVALAGGAAGMLVAVWANRLLVAAFQWKERGIDLALDWRVLGFGVGVSLLTALLFGIAPAIQFLRGGRVALNQERTVAPRFGAGGALVVVEVALSLVMVAGAAVFIRSFQNLRSVPTGFSAENVTALDLAAREGGEPAAADVEGLADTLRAAPRIEAVAVADYLPFNDGSIGFTASLPEAPQAMRPVKLLRVDGDYFGALRIPLVAGRRFTPRDDERAPRVVILAETTARRLFAGQTPIGKSILLLGRVGVQVVGVVGDIKFSTVTAPPPDVVYQPVLQPRSGGAFMGSAKLQVRSRLKPQDIAALARSRIRDQDLSVNVESVRTLEDAVGASMESDRLRMRASALFASLALLLIAAGVYGLMAYAVARRTREIGIRMAIGSKPAAIVRMVLTESVRLVAIGVAIGLPGAIAVMKAVSGMLFGLAPIDAVSLAAAATVLIATSIAASVAPALRAAHLDPVSALRVQ